MVQISRADLRLNPFHTGRGLSTQAKFYIPKCQIRLNPFHTGRGLSTWFLVFDVIKDMVLIPFIQGGVFRPKRLIRLVRLIRLNPFHTGRGLSTKLGAAIRTQELSLNPFHTGRGLSTDFPC